MNDIILVLAISVIIIGFLILVGVALWLAAERRRNRFAAQGQPAPQRASRAAAQPPQTASQGSGAQGQPPGEAAAPAAPEGPAGSTSPAGAPPHKDANSSGEYPSAALYDQTLLPERSKRRTPPQSP